jgi:hypothetical protein
MRSWPHKRGQNILFGTEQEAQKPDWASAQIGGDARLRRRA